MKGLLNADLPTDWSRTLQANKISTGPETSFWHKDLSLFSPKYHRPKKKGRKGKSEEWREIDIKQVSGVKCEDDIGDQKLPEKTGVVYCSPQDSTC